MPSPFLEMPMSRWVASNALAFAIRDGYPVSDGHTLVIPRREFATWFEATPEERTALFALVDEVKAQLDAGQPKPDGYNIGINVGTAAGQTVLHLHVHVIPRYSGDMEDPRGGVRHVIPGKGNYLAAARRPLATGGDRDPFLGHLAPLLESATEVAVVAAFVQDSGLDLIRGPVLRRLDAGARMRLVTGDYLDLTQASALESLLDWSRLHAAFEARVVETAGTSVRSFHPKSWRLEGPEGGTAFVGSSNLSQTALLSGVEWNLRVDRGIDPVAYRGVVEAFETLWAGARVLDAEWVRLYAERAREFPQPLPPGDADRDSVAPPEPHLIQQDALDALAASRQEGRARALVVLATGLGKTWLAAFDVAAFWKTHARRPRVLFIAHRVELLLQAASTFRRLYRQLGMTPRVGFFVGERDELDRELVFASVIKLAGQAERLDGQRFDYVIVDEVHHATAASYRKVMARLAPGFLLGLTATPDRTDEADVLGLFDDHLAYRADLGAGIEADLLSPFAYHGLKDVVDYANIPWRNRRFDPEKLGQAVQTQSRMEKLWAAWEQHPSSRTIVFCCSIAHANFVRTWLAARGQRVVAVDANTPSRDRAQALADLEQGRLDALCAVDLFNEGVDIPGVDRVVMLRPTESALVFLQQLGRGLRKSPGKDRLVVIDFVGNHRVFLERVRRLASFGTPGGEAALRAFLEGARDLALPPGCSVDIELEAKDMLLRLLPAGARSVREAYEIFRDTHGRRSSAAELYRLGHNVSLLRGWFAFVKEEGDLSEAEASVWSEAEGWLRDLERTSMNKSFKMVLLDVLIGADALGTGMDLSVLAAQSHACIARSPELLKDLQGVLALGGDPRRPDPAAWDQYWRRNPVHFWTTGPDSRWFGITGDRFVPKLPVPVGREGTFAEMTRELVEYRLARYRVSKGLLGTDAFRCRVTWNKRDPILKLPQAEVVPADDTTVRLPDGTPWTFGFRKEFCNVARATGSARNELPDLLRGWFGPSAGRPGTSFQVVFSRTADGWWVEPERPVADAQPGLPFYGFLKAAAGEAQRPDFTPVPPEPAWLPVRYEKGLFAARALGDSMEGGSDPIRDGDWLVMRWARGTALPSLRDRVALVEIREAGDHASHQLKRLVERDGQWLLQADNPRHPTVPVGEATPIAVLRRVVRPESLAPPVGELLTSASLRRVFGFPVTPTSSRQQGHLFLFLEADEPGELELTIPDRRHGETAYVLRREADDAWRYRGIARWDESAQAWRTTAAG